MCLPRSTQFHPPPVRVKHGGGASSADVDDVEDDDALSQVPFSLSTRVNSQLSRRFRYVVPADDSRIRREV